MIKRIIQQRILKNLDRNKIIILTGARQVGKTTILNNIKSLNSDKTLFLNGDEPDIRERLTRPTSTYLRTLIGSSKIIIIDEAQRIQDIGITLKLLIDSIPGVNIIASGSSALELASTINEPLTGSKIQLQLYPLSYTEIENETSILEENRLVGHRLVYGSYPEVVTNPGSEIEILRELTTSYLYKDLFSLERIRKPFLLEKLLQALAFQVGSEVSFLEISRFIGADNETVEKYIDLLEKAFVIFRLSSLSRNFRKEIKRSKKIYFYDNGIRNAIIKNFNPIGLRNDIGALWENYIISEGLKYNENSGKWVNSWFWRTIDRKEIDYIEEYDGKIHAYEIKWNPSSKVRIPKSFVEAYPDSEFKTINNENYFEFLTGFNPNNQIL